MKFITTDKLILEEAINNVTNNKDGAVVTFSGTIRDTEDDKPIMAIDYEAYSEMAEKELNTIVEETKKSLNVSIFIKHRIGKVLVGEASLIVAVAACHRKEAFIACEKVIDEIKAKVPIWKVEFEEARC